MASSFTVYFAGIGTVVAAMGVGFGGALFLADTSAVKVKEAPAAVTAKPDTPKAAEPGPDQAKEQATRPAREPVQELEQRRAITPVMETTGSRPAADGMQWIETPPAMPASATPMTASPIIPTAAPLMPPPPRMDDPPAPAAAAPPAASPKAAAVSAQDNQPDQKKRKDAARSDRKAKPPAAEKTRKPARPSAPREADNDEVAVADPPERIIELPGMKPVGAVSGNAH